MTAALLLAAAVSAVGGPGVPEPVLQRARTVLEAALGDADARLEMFRTAEEMTAAVRKVDPDAEAGDFAAYFHRESRTIYAWMAPHADDRLFADRLPGPLLGALVHEAQHVKAPDARPSWRAEGEADLAAVSFLARTDWVGRGAWAWMLESRVWRARKEGLFAPEGKFKAMTPFELPAAQRAVWYAQAYDLARGQRRADLPWILWQGTADPIERGSFRLYPHSHVVRHEPGELDVLVTPVIPGDLVIRFDRGRIRLREAGGWQWHPSATGDDWEGSVHAGPPLRAETRIEFDGREVRVDGDAILLLRPREGRVGLCTGSGAFDVKDVS